MQVEVGHGLPTIPADVGHDPIAVIGQAQGPGRFTRREKQVAGQPLVLRSQVIRRNHMLLRDHQKVRGSLGVDVPEGESTIIVVDHLSGNLPGDNATEDAVIGHEGDLLDQGAATGVMGPSPTPDRPEFSEADPSIHGEARSRLLIYPSPS